MRKINLAKTNLFCKRKSYNAGEKTILHAITEVQNKIAYSVDEAAEQTTLSKSHIRNEIRDGNLKARKIGRRVLILNEDLQTYLRKDEKQK